MLSDFTFTVVFNICDYTFKKQDMYSHNTFDLLQSKVDLRVVHFCTTGQR